jgi:hypothetical protein
MPPEKKGCEWCDYEGYLSYIGIDEIDDADIDSDVYIYDCPDCGRENAGQLVG